MQLATESQAIEITLLLRSGATLTAAIRQLKDRDHHDKVAQALAGLEIADTYLGHSGGATLRLSGDKRRLRVCLADLSAVTYQFRMHSDEPPRYDTVTVLPDPESEFHGSREPTRRAG